ncbi:hypothetical protein D5R40_32545 [Okeania hirsuta]|uniref:Uncharacterized protein n=1 Tax=Okeania hirsuta TaxID=1458930 RepID=A0A3N6NRA9_9CYAN|nr:hypothetical protein D5R40_32545 [Okeania hirsuta]
MFFAIWGLYAAAPKDAFCSWFGICGIVSKVGSSGGHGQGECIMGVRFGAYTTHLNIDHRYLFPYLRLEFAEVSAYLVQMLTAYLRYDQQGRFAERTNDLDS